MQVLDKVKDSWDPHWVIVNNEFKRKYPKMKILSLFTI
jgi:hypothetical protein